MKINKPSEKKAVRLAYILAICSVPLAVMWLPLAIVAVGVALWLIIWRTE